MKALSIRQPWPWLITRPDVIRPGLREAVGTMGGFKDVENRTWETAFRGKCIIHTGQKYDAEGEAWVRDNFPWIPLPNKEDMPRGGIVGRMNILDCVEAHPSHWFQGPYGFVIIEARPLSFQPYPGRLGFFNVEIPHDLP